MFNLFKSLNAQKIEKPLIHKDMTLEEVRIAMLQLMAAENTNHYSMGELYNYVVDNKLAEAAGHKNAPDYFSKALPDVSLTALKVYGTVAENFSEPVAHRFGVTRLSLLVTYKEAADLEVNHEEPADTAIEVPGQNGAVELKAFSLCSVEELRQAIQRKRKPASSKPLPEGALVVAEKVRKEVTGRFPKGVLVRVQLRNHKGKAVLDFKGIPVEQVAQLREALMAYLPPMPPAQQAEEPPRKE